MIRQVITCDICGTQKRETNHWFVAYEESGELRISGWNSLHLLSPEAKHLCGETCAHKLISHFLMRLVDGGAQRSADKGDTRPTTEEGISVRTDCAKPSHSTWSGSTGTPGSSEPPQYARRAPERMQRSHLCTGRRT